MQKFKKQIKGKIDQMTTYFLQNPDKVISKEELAGKFFGSKDLIVIQLVTQGYTPLIRKKLELNYDKSLKNFRGQGWQVVSKPELLLDVALASEKLLLSHNESLKRKIKIIPKEKLSSGLKSLAISLDNLIKMVEGARGFIGDARNNLVLSELTKLKEK